MFVVRIVNNQSHDFHESKFDKPSAARFVCLNEGITGQALKISPYLISDEFVNSPLHHRHSVKVVF